jgi:hypothetical protein
MLPNTDGFNESSQVSPLPTATPTSTPTDEPVPQPTDVPPSPTPTHTPPAGTVTHVFDGPSSTTLNETFQVNVMAKNVPNPGLYGVQFIINYDPSKVSVSNLQGNANLSVVVRDNIDNSAGTVSFAATQHGRVSGLTGDVVLLSFDVKAIDVGSATFTFEDVKFSDSDAQSFGVVSGNYEVKIEQGASTPVPTVEPTATSTIEPTPQPTDEPTPEPTESPTPEPTIEPTPQPTSSPTPQPATAAVSGQIILAGRSDNDWSGATAKINSVEQTDTTNATGDFEFTSVPMGLHTVSANAPGYLSATCSGVNVAATQMTLTPVSLLAGDIDDDDAVDIVDATIAGASFGQTDSNPADITQDQVVDIFDIVLVSVNYGETGPQVWNCLD